MLGSVLLWGYVAVAVGLVYTLVFGQSEYHRRGLVGRLNAFLTGGLWAALGRRVQRHCGPKWLRRMQAVHNYCCWRPNPFMQLVYLGLVIPGYLIFIRDGYPHIPGPALGAVHRTIGHVSVAGVVAFFLFVCGSDPGTITSHNVDRYIKAYPFDGVLYHPKTCTTCAFTRPARSKHCRICDRCVARFDHHCPWINNCVGELNLRWFILFIVVTATLLVYCSWLCWRVSYGVFIKEDLLKPGVGVQLKSGKTIPVTKSFLFQYAIYKTGLVVPLGMFCGLLAPILYGFAAYQMWEAAQGVTTNESFKWSDVREGARRQGIPVSSIQNRYNRGVLLNWLQIFFPSSRWPFIASLRVSNKDH
eukprot:m51a1_g8765 hypothetical protein (359) ;mRNA; f:144990-146833